jgi:hypothetical protein
LALVIDPIDKETPQGVRTKKRAPDTLALMLLYNNVAGLRQFRGVALRRKDLAVQCLAAVAGGGETRKMPSTTGAEHLDIEVADLLA